MRSAADDLILDKDLYVSTRGKYPAGVGIRIEKAVPLHVEALPGGGRFVEVQGVGLKQTVPEKRKFPGALEPIRTREDDRLVPLQHMHVSAIHESTGPMALP